MIEIRRAMPEDSVGIADVHVTAWRNAYAGILPEAYLAQLSAPRKAREYRAGIEWGHPAYVAVEHGTVVGFVTAGRARSRLADGEIETLYVLDDYREQGAGRGLIQRAAGRLARAGCRSAMAWVLSGNPSRWFYLRLGGRQAAESVVQVAGQGIPQTAFIWDPIELLSTAPAQH